MPSEYRAQLAFVALAGIALGSAVTYEVEHFNAPKPIIISDAVNVPPNPQSVMVSSAASSASDDAVVSPSTAIPATSSDLAHKPRSKRSRGHKKITSGVIHINSATLDELEELPGVGPTTAQGIIDFRTQAGGFSSTDELGDIPRMGKKKLAKLMPFVAL
jgi:competence ComEA-like helix-hairpin-helix protein